MWQVVHGCVVYYVYEVRARASRRISCCFHHPPSRWQRKIDARETSWTHIVGLHSVARRTRAEISHGDIDDRLHRHLCRCFRPNLNLTMRQTRRHLLFSNRKVEWCIWNRTTGSLLYKNSFSNLKHALNITTDQKKTSYFIFVFCWLEMLKACSSHAIVTIRWPSRTYANCCEKVSAPRTTKNCIGFNYVFYVGRKANRYIRYTSRYVA